LNKLNDKNYKEIISSLDLIMTAIDKLGVIDLDQTRFSSFTAKEKIQKALQGYNEKNAEKLRTIS
jgi:hypothetical protein